MINFERTILSQYSSSPTIFGIIEKFNENMDLSSDLKSFYDNYFNIDTAVGEGLDIWGEIVGVSRRLKVNLTNDVVGFNYTGWTSASRWKPLSQAPAYGGRNEGYIDVDDSSYRLIIKAKAAANISDGTIQSLNVFLKSYFNGRGVAYARDNYDMSITYVCGFPITDFDRSVLLDNNISPSIAGVVINLETTFIGT